MNKKQTAFADEYLKTHNATAAYMTVYQCDNARTAQACSSRLLSNAIISEYIHAQMESVHNESIADAVEIMQFYTKVIRGEISAKMKDRINAAWRLSEMLGVSNRIAIERLKLQREKYERISKTLEQANSTGVIAEIVKAVERIQ